MKKRYVYFVLQNGKQTSAGSRLIDARAYAASLKSRVSDKVTIVVTCYLEGFACCEEVYSKVIG